MTKTGIDSVKVDSAKPDADNRTTVLMMKPGLPALRRMVQDAAVSRAVHGCTFCWLDRN